MELFTRTIIAGRMPGKLCLFRMCALTFLMLIQATFAYGFCDASLLIMNLNQLPTYMDPLDNSLFYPESIVPGTTTPCLKLLNALAALIILAILLKNDNE